MALRRSQRFSSGTNDQDSARSNVETKKSKTPTLLQFKKPLASRFRVIQAKSQPEKYGVRLSGLEALPKDTKGDLIKKLFEENFGEVVESNFPVNPRTGFLVGSGEIYFTNESNAKQAVTWPITLDGRPLKLEYCSSSSKSNEHSSSASTSTHSLRVEIGQSFTRNLYVKNIAGGFRNEIEFVDLFKKCGPIKSHKIVTKPNGDWAGFGFVCFENLNDAKRAVETLHNRNLPNGRKLHVSKYESKGSRPPAAATELPGHMKVETKLRPRFFGPSASGVKSVGNTGTSQLKLSTRSEDKENASSDYDDENGSTHSETDHESHCSLDTLDSSSKLKLKRHYLNTEDKEFQNLYVKNFSGLIKTDEDLEGAFKIFGRIQSVKLRGPDFGYVCFKDSKHAQVAIDALDGKKIGNGRELRVVKALSKEERELEKNKKHVRVGGPCEPEYLYAGAKAIPIPKGDQECSMCCKKNQKPLVLLECLHFYCKPCLTEWLTIHIDTEDLDAVHCPHQNCGEEFDHNLLKVLVDKKTFIKYDKMLLHALLDTMDNIVNCTECGCPTSIDLDCPSALAYCKKCSHYFSPI